MANNQNSSNRKGLRDPKKFMILAGVILLFIIISGASVTMKPLTDYFSEFNDAYKASEVYEASDAYKASEAYEASEAYDASETSKDAAADAETVVIQYEFRKQDYLDEHYEKHGIEMGFESAEEYLAAANAMIAHPDVLTKKEKEDNDDVYFLESTGEFAVVSTDGYLRTYYYADKAYFDRQ